MGSELEDIVVVRISGALVGVRAADCIEVLLLAQPTMVPDWPENVLGVLDLHGVLMPCLDAAAAVLRPPSTLSINHMLLVVKARGLPWALLVDEVVSVTAQPVLPIGTGVADVLPPSLVVVGVMEHAEGMVPVLDVGALISWLPRFEHPADKAPLPKAQATEATR